MKKRNGKKNRRNERGVITVLVTLILIPTVFFTGFLVDLTRIKMFTNQAVMSADTYGEAILTDYDNLLREMYGLFGVSQDAPHAAVKRDAYIGDFNEDILATFDLSQTTRWGYNFWNGTIFDKWAGVGDPRNGKVIPFRTVDAKLDYDFMENATLMDQTVFGTQVGDFMKIRFVQVVGEDSEALVQAIDKINNMEGDAKVIKSKREYDEQAGKALKALQAYYEKLKDYEKYALKVREFHDDCHNHTRPLLESAQEEYDWEQEKRAEFEQKQKEREAAAANGEEVEDDGESLEDL
ncbi:MAG: hypothetical protein K6G16_10900, partial [Lachnospiraceae bacterium]|nr:hypothetical protein [Lachnospiraceae bacterium]